MTKTVYVVRLPCGLFVGGNASRPWHPWHAFWRGPVDFARARVFLSRAGASGIALKTGGEIIPCTVNSPCGASVLEES